MLQALKKTMLNTLGLSLPWGGYCGRLETQSAAPVHLKIKLHLYNY